jgi:hypothetical protein
MAEMGNSQTIEDVLSSIRRLVAEDPQHVPERLPTAAAPARAAVAADRLVLTPQLRVTYPEDPYQMIRALTNAAQAEAVEEGPLANVLSAEGPQEETSVAPQPADADHVDIGSTIDDFYAEDQDFEPGAAVLDGDPHSEAADHLVSAPQTDLPQHAISGEGDEFDDTPSGTIPFRHAQTATPVSGDVDVPDAAPVQARDEDPLMTTDLVLDEDALREMIAEVVREELAGQLGERITRNVRKLVRREIRQMMATEELE